MLKSEIVFTIAAYSFRKTLVLLLRTSAFSMIWSSTWGLSPRQHFLFTEDFKVVVLRKLVLANVSFIKLSSRLFSFESPQSQFREKTRVPRQKTVFWGKRQFSEILKADTDCFAFFLATRHHQLSNETNHN